jgi:hypothetical protein
MVAGIPRSWWIHLDGHTILHKTANHIPNNTVSNSRLESSAKLLCEPQFSQGAMCWYLEGNARDSIKELRWYFPDRNNKTPPMDRQCPS